MEELRPDKKWEWNVDTYKRDWYMNKCDILNQELLTNNGFVYRKRGWYRCTEDFLQIINFQKSNWGNQYYINIGENCLSRLNAGSIIYPPERLFHLRITDNRKANKFNIPTFNIFLPASKSYISFGPDSIRNDYEK